MIRNKRLVPATIFVPIMVGLIGVFMVSRNQRFELFHTVDILQLLASGMCFGVALTLIVLFIKNK